MIRYEDSVFKSRKQFEKIKYPVEKNLVRGIAYEDKQIVVFENLDNKIMTCYSLEGDVECTVDTYKNARKKPRSSPIIFVRKPKDCESMKTFYEDHIKTADELKLISADHINLYQTGRIEKACLKLFYDLIGPVYPQQITNSEFQYLKNASMGGLIFAKKYKGPGYKYDINSFYPSLMHRSHDVVVPLTEGESYTLTDEYINLCIEDTKSFEVGIYNIELIGDNILFRKNPTNHYTHIELKFALCTLKFKYRLIKDKDNAMIWKRSNCTHGCKVFKKYIDLLYPMKKAGKKSVKPMLNKLWGSLCQTNTFTKIFSYEDDLPDHQNIISMIRVDNGLKIEYYESHKPYETNFARMKPFITARGRIKIAEMMLPYIDDIYRCHTDGFISSKELPFILNDELGGMKLEGKSKNIHIKNCNTVIGF